MIRCEPGLIGGPVYQRDPKCTVAGSAPLSQAGDGYFQEVHVGDASDEGEVLARGETIETALGTFDGVVRTRDTALEPDALEHKLYGPDSA